MFSPASVRKLPGFRVKSKASAAAPRAEEVAHLQAHSGNTQSHELLAMQKVVGSSPISRFRKGLHLQVFFVRAVGWCSSRPRATCGTAVLLRECPATERFASKVSCRGSNPRPPGPQSAARDPAALNLALQSEISSVSSPQFRSNWYHGWYYGPGLSRPESLTSGKGLSRSRDSGSSRPRRLVL
jgi:hypothetical protein